MVTIVLSAVFCVASAQSGPAPADAAQVPFEEAVRSVGPGQIDWTNLKLVVDSRSDRTVGAWKDRRVQEQDALDSIAPRMDAAARRIPVTADSTAGDLYGGGELGTRLEEGARSWQVTETRYHQSGGVEMAATLDLRAWLLPVLAQLAVADPPRLATAAGAPTGIVVDARGLPFEPSLVPSISTVDAQPIVRANLLAPSIDARAAPVVYVTDPADPRAFSRAGGRPLFARAASADGAMLVLAPGDTLTPSPTVAGLVAARRVVVVIDP
jgi:hypothetical protein